MVYTTIKEISRGKLTLRILKGHSCYEGTIVSAHGGRLALVKGISPEEVWRKLEEEEPKCSKEYFGFDGARSRFLGFFPEGFESSRFIQQEREYKSKASNKLATTVPLSDVLDGSNFGPAILRVYQSTDLLAPIEKAKLQDLLRGPQADAFVRAIACFTLSPNASSLSALAQLLRPSGSAKWTVVTYLPFLWRPETHMFLKPEVMSDFAERVGHRFKVIYRPSLEFAIYESLIDLARETEVKLADLHPKDRIDIQSFMWIVGKYVEADRRPSSASTPPPPD